jgi:hypothetical protein
MTGADGEAGAETYAAATDKDQAGFSSAMPSRWRSNRPASRSASRSQAVRDESTTSRIWRRGVSSGHLERIVGQGQIRLPSALRLLGRDPRAPDERDGGVPTSRYEGPPQALIFMITNSESTGPRSASSTTPTQRKSQPAKSRTIRSSAMCARGGRNARRLSRRRPVHRPDRRETRLPAAWLKANPLLGVTFQPSYLEEQVRQAKGMPSKESIVRRLNFCQWVDALNPWIDGDLWRACEVTEDFPSTSTERPRVLRRVGPVEQARL